MAFDYNGTRNIANELRNYAVIINSHKNTILSMQNSVHDSWKSAMVPQIDVLFGEVEQKCNNIFSHLHSAAGGIDQAARDIRNEEIAAQEAARQQTVPHETARQQAVPQETAQPTPATPKKKSSSGTKSTKKKGKKGKKEEEQSSFFDRLFGNW